MNGYVTPKRLANVIDIPINCAQVELRRGKRLQIAQIPLLAGQRFKLKILSLHVIRCLTPGAVLEYATTSLGAVSAGLYFGSALTSPLALASVSSLGVSSTNPYSTVQCISSGVYTVVVSNNTLNADFSVAVNGCIKYFL